MQHLLSQGAEAKIFLELSPEKATKSKINKVRISKTYRHPKLDEKIRRLRTKHESKILEKAHSAKINVPKIHEVNKSNFTISMEFIEGDRLSETLNNHTEEKQFDVMKKIAEQVSLLHKNNIIHGDLTTSNTILSDDKVYIIDFGLGFISTKIEDKAVDLHLIKQALEAKHFQNWQDLFEIFCENYLYEDSEKVLERLNIVEKRGRYKG